MKNRGLTVIEVMIVVAILGILGVVTVSSIHNARVAVSLQSEGYSRADLRAFHRATGISYVDIKESRAIRQQFEAFLRGETTEFMRQSIAKKRSDDARDTAIAVGVAAGMAAGSAK